MELEREAKEGLEKVRKEWQSVNELAVKEPFKCAAASIQTLEDGVKLLLEYGFGEIVEFNEEYTVQKAIRESSFFNVFGMNGVNNANSLYLIARYWVDKRVPADVANELCKKLNDFYATLSNAFAANCGYKPKNFQPPVEKIVDEFDAENPFDENPFEEKNEEENKKMEKQNVKTGMLFYRRTNAELINGFFGTNYKQLMKCSYKKLPEGLANHMWFTAFNGDIHSGWRNVLSADGNTIVEDFLGKTKPSNVEFDPSENIRIVFDKYMDLGRRVYEFLGVFKYDKTESTSYHRVYRKIADETNQIKTSI